MKIKIYETVKNKNDILTLERFNSMLSYASGPNGEKAVYISGGNLAANSIYGASIVSESITAEQIKAESITGDVIKAGSITTSHITAGGIDAQVIKTGILKSIVDPLTVGSLINLDTGDLSLAGGNLTWNSSKKEFYINANRITIGGNNLLTEKTNLIQMINDDPNTTVIDGKKLHFTSDVKMDNAYITKLTTSDLFMENVNSYSINADRITTGNLDISTGLNITNGKQPIITLGTDNSITFNASSISVNSIPVPTVQEVEEKINEIELTPGTSFSWNMLYDTKDIVIGGLSYASGSEEEYQAQKILYDTTGIAFPLDVTISFDIEHNITAGINLQIHNKTNKGPIEIKSSEISKIPSGKSRQYVQTQLLKRTAHTITDNYIEFYSTYGTSHWYKITNLKIESGFQIKPLWAPHIMEIKGDSGKDGLPGKNGVGIKSTETEVSYQGSSDGTNPPTGIWKLSVPSVPPGDYLWTRTVWKYTDGTDETGYTVSRIGKDGNTGKDGIAGKDGVGITKTTITYAKSTNGKTAPTSGWDKDVPSANPGEYIWTKTVWEYTDSTTETGYSVGKIGNTGPKGDKGDTGPQGVQGPKGADGKPTYTWVRYSPNANGSGMTNLPDANTKYIGIATNKTVETESNTASDYVWSKFIGDNGVPGQKGADGKTTYTWIKYADTATGVEMSNDPTGKLYMGIAYNKLTATESDTASDYTWSLIKGAKGDTGPQGARGPQGIQGPAGSNGQSQWVHIRYSANSNGASMTPSPSSTTKYVGIAVTNSATAPAYTGFTWSKYVGENGSQGPQGVPGKNGTNGTTTYTWVRYADTPTSGMNQYPDGKKYIGLAFNKATQTESNNYNDYKWSLMPQNIEIGGRNLLLNSSDLILETTPRNNGTASDNYNYVSLKLNLKKGTEYTLSFELEKLGLDYSRVSVYTQYGHTDMQTINLTNSTRQHITFTAVADTNSAITYIYAGVGGNTVGRGIKLSKIKLEKGNIATDWTPAPEDVAASIKAAQDKANDASNSASAANSLLSDIASDSKLTPTEKKATKKEWDIIVGEKPKIDSSADTYGITTQKTAYNTAYNALNTYLSSLLANLNTTSNIVGTTFRANFKAYYDARQDLLNAIADGAKSLVNGIQVGGRNLLFNSGNFTDSYDGWEDNGGGISIDKSTNYEGHNTIKTTVSRGIKADRWYKLENDVVYTYSMMIKSNVTFPHSYSSPLHWWSGFNEINQGKITFLGGDTSYTSNDIGKFKKLWLTFKLIDDADSFRPFLYGGSNITSGTVNIAYIKLEKGNKATDWSPAPEDVQANIDNINIGSTNYLLNSAVPNITGNNGAGITKTMNSEGKLQVTAAAGNGNYLGDMGLLASAANVEANIARGELVTFSIEVKSPNSTKAPNFYFGSGMGYYPMSGTVSTTYSKIFVTKEWTATGWSPHLGFQDVVGTYVFRNAKLEKGNKPTDWSPSPEDLTDKISFQAVESNVNMFTKVMGSTEANVKTNIAKITMTDSLYQTEVKKIHDNTSILSRMGDGVHVLSDFEFDKGYNGVAAYDNANTGRVTVVRETNVSSSTQPNGKKNRLKITHVGGGTNPGWGGIFSYANARINAEFIVKFNASLPTGREFNHANNSLGTGSSVTWITDKKGEGVFRDYIYHIKCGSSGSFSNFGHLYVHGGATPTSTSPLIWYLSSYDIIDISKSNALDMSTKVTQLSNSWALTLKSGKDIKTEINATTDGLRLFGKNIQLDGNVTMTSSFSVPNANIGNLSASKITSGTIDAERIDAKTIVANGLVAGQITADHINASTAFFDKVASGTSLTNRLAAKTAWIGTAAIADAAITGAKIANLAVTNAKIVDAAITSAKISSLAVTGAKIADATIETAKIANLAVTGAKIANLAVTNAKIVDSAITNAKISNLAVTNAKIADATITNAKIANLTITSAKIANATIGSAQIGSIDASNGKITNINAKYITANRAELVSAGFNGINSNTQISGEGLVVQNTNNGSWVKLTNNGELRSEDEKVGLVLAKGRLQVYDAGGVNQGYVGIPLHNPTAGKFGIYLPKGSRGFEISMSTDATSTPAVYYTVKSGQGWSQIVDSVVAMKVIGTVWGTVNTTLRNLNGIPASATPVFHPGDKILVKKEVVVTGDSYWANYVKFDYDSNKNLAIYFNQGVQIYNGMTIQAGTLWVKTTLNVTGTFKNTSDIKLKENIEDTNINALTEINNLAFKQFDWKKDKKHQDIGLIAQDAGIFRVKGKDEEEPEAVDITKLVYTSAKAIQELSKEINLLKQQNKELKAKLNKKGV